MVRWLVVGVVLSAACVDPMAVVLNPLHVINWSPSSGAICVDPSFPIHVTFSDNLEVDTLTPKTFKLLEAAGSVAAQIDYDERVSTAILIPDQALDYARQYTIVVTSGVSGREVGPLPVDLESSCKTIARTGSRTPEPTCQL
ncbi:MAG: Ig-like domain-containing protein, partial [Deltaproteobacteria bacterium]|nr:Ig-like domain-containing protein [Deltaproteobacteria bacterium]